MKFDALLGESYVLASDKADCERSINVWRERIESDQGTGPVWMRRSPGIRPLITNLGVGTVREMFQANSEASGGLFAVVNDSVYYGSDPAAMGVFSTKIQPTGFIQMAASVTSLMIVSDGHLYRINSAALTEITVPFTPIGVVFLKNYFIVLAAELGQFYWSEDDGATFPADQVQTAEADANNVLAIQVLHQQLWLIGSRISQVYFVGPNPNAPFVPNDSGVIRSGTIAAASVRALGDSLYWLEDTAEGRNSVVRTRGYAIEKVSNNYIDAKLDTITVDDAVGWTFEISGTEFYRLSFPTADISIEFNATLKEWEEIISTDFVTSTDHRHRCQSAVNAFDKTLVGDRDNGIIYEMTVQEYTDAGFPIRSNRRAPHITEEQKTIRYGRLDLMCETGVGLVDPLWLNDYTLQPDAFLTALTNAVGGGTVTVAQSYTLQDIYDGVPYTPLNPYPDPATMVSLGFYPWGRDPVITMSYSNNGGKQFGMGVERSLGAAGENDLMVYWNRLGQAKDRVFDFVDMNPCKLAWTGCDIEAEALGK